MFDLLISARAMGCMPDAIQAQSPFGHRVVRLTRQTICKQLNPRYRARAAFRPNLSQVRSHGANCHASSSAINRVICHAVLKRGRGETVERDLSTDREEV